jgi:tetratricopeptide (TPR) repeat protein
LDQITQEHTQGRSDLATYFTKLGAAQEMAEQANDRAALVFCRLRLGFTNLMLNDWEAAETDFTALQSDDSIAGEPGMTLAIQYGLQKCAVMQQNPIAAAAAYQAVLEILPEIQQTQKFALLGYMHLRAGRFEEALQESTKAFSSHRKKSLGDDLDYGGILVLQTDILFGLGRVDAAMNSAREARQILRFGKIPPHRRDLAWRELADLGDDLWRNGESELASECLRDAIAGLESGPARRDAFPARLDLARILIAQNRFDEARQILPGPECLLPTRARQLRELQESFEPALSLAAGH